MSTNLRGIVPVGALAIALSFAGFAPAQDNSSKPANQQQSKQDSSAKDQEQKNNQKKDQQKDQDQKTEAQRTKCAVCGLTVQPAGGNDKGLKVVDVAKDSPAAKADIKKGDVVVSVAGQDLNKGDQLKKQMQSAQKPDENSDVKLKVRRDGKDREVTLTLQSAKQAEKEKANKKKDNAKDQDNKKDKDQARMNQSSRRQGAAPQEYASLGVTLDPYSAVQPEPGVRISAVYKDGPAQKAKIEPGDRILKLNNQEVVSLQEIQRLVRELKPEDRVEVTIWSAGKEKEVKVQLGTRAEAMKGAIISTSSYDGDENAENRDNRDGRRRSARAGDTQRGPTLQQAIAKKLQKSNDAEVELAKIALKKSDSDDVKDLANMIVKDHEALNKKLEQVGKQKSDTDRSTNQTGNDQDRDMNAAGNNVRIPQQLVDIVAQASDNALKMSKELLEGRDGYNFDMAYLGQNIAAHTMLLAELKAIQSKGPSELKDVVQTAVEKTQSHLQKAKQLSEKLESNAGDKNKK